MSHPNHLADAPADAESSAMLHVELPLLSIDRSEYQKYPDIVVDDDDDGEEAGESEPSPRTKPANGRNDGGPELLKEMRASFRRFEHQGADMIRKTHNWMAINRPTIDGLAQVKRLLPRLALGYAWAARDRTLAARFWSKNPRRERFLNVGGNRDLLTLYKSCLRLMRCLPEDIISCQYDLDYDMSQNRQYNPHQGKQASLVWSVPFCKLLTALLVHPLWAGNVQLLALSIQYAVIVDTVDRQGPWGANVKVPAWDGFLSSLLNIKRGSPQRSVVDIRQELTLVVDS